MRKLLIALLLLIATLPTGLVSAETGSWSNDSDNFQGVMISEILVSPNNENYNGTDWNGDGEYGSSSDQYIMIRTEHNLLISQIGPLTILRTVAVHRA